MKGGFRMQQGRGDSAAAKAISELVKKVLVPPELRQAFLSDPRGTLQRAGIDADKIPPGILETLSGMSYEELSAVAGIGQGVAEFERRRGCFLF